MRKYLACVGVLLMILTISAATAAGETKVAIGAKFGLNFPTMTGNLVDTMVAGVEADAGYVVRGIFGVFATIGLSDRWALQPEILYSQKAGDWEWNLKSGEYTATITNLIEVEYIEIPVLVRFTIPQTGDLQPFFYGGPALAFHSKSSAKLVAVTDSADIRISYFDTYASNIYNAKSTIAEIVVGAGFEWKMAKNRLMLEARYSRSMTALFENIDDFSAIPEDDAFVAKYPSGEALELGHSVFSIILGLAFSL